MKRFIKFASPYKRFFIFGPMLVLIGAMGEVLLPRMAAELINSAAAGSGTDAVFSKGLPMFIFALTFAGVTLSGTQLSTRASILFSADIRKESFTRIQGLSFSGLDTFQTGSLVTRLTNDTAQIQQFTMQMLRMGVRSPAHLFGAVIMAFLINYKLAIVILAVVPALVAATVLIIRIALPRFKILQEKMDKVNALLQEAITNVRLIKSYVREDYEIGRFGESNSSLAKASLEANRVMLLQRLSMTLAMNAATIAVVWVGGAMIMAGSMPVGDLAAFITYVTQILTSLMMFSNMLLTSSRALVSARRITEILDAPLEEDNVLSSKIVDKGSIEFKNVSFRYLKDSPSPILDNISFSLSPGQTVGLVGSTGSGKTTLIHMMPGLIKPDSGQVLVDGEDISRYPLKELRDSICLVLQSSFLFSGSVSENLAWGKEDATKEEMAHAAQMAAARMFIENLPDGYETTLEQGGANLSGGQRQRLCLARAILKSPKALILDDAASAVDTATEASIRNSLKEELPGTKIIISQRIASVKEADKILVLEKGKLVGEGTHDELLLSSETYRQICSSQTGGELSG